MSNEDFQQHLRQTFRLEAEEQVRLISSNLFELSTSSGSGRRGEIVEAIFRCAHTLKGSARLVGEARIESICAKMEAAFAAFQDGSLPLTPESIDAFHELLDLVRDELNAQQGKVEKPAARDAGSTVSAAPISTVGTAAPMDQSVEKTRLSSSVRVPAERLDRLLVQAEELVAAKDGVDQVFAGIRNLNTRSAEWKKRWNAVRSQMNRLRRGSEEVDYGFAAELEAVLNFLDWNHDFQIETQRATQELSRTAKHEQRSMNGLIDELLHETNRVLLESFSSLFERFPAFVRGLSREQGKEIDLNFSGGDVEIDRRVLEELRDVLVHLVRNAIDHGIELPEQRSAKGKNPRANFSISAQSRLGGHVELVVSDDGAGVDLARVHERAVALNVIEDKTAPLPKAEALQLLFHSGFSTRSSVDEISGRGLGLAIVREKVERLGGSVTIETEAGRFTTFRVLVPVTMARFRGIFLEAENQTFVLPAAFVKRMLRVSSSELRRAKGQTIILADGLSLPVYSLVKLLGLSPAAASEAPKTVFVVLISDGHDDMGVTVENIPFEQEVVMKGLGPLLPRVRNIAGATIVGGGRVLPVLNAKDLLSGASRRSVTTTPRVTAAKPRKRQRILVAEDSITSRTLLKNILHTSGYDVRTVVDGIEALTALKYEETDLVISDVQMPRMDGFELTRRIRADEKLSTLPVVLITSLASDADKERGVDAGANAYIVKSSFDQSDLLQTLRRLL